MAPEPAPAGTRLGEHPWVKICGITQVRDAELAVRLGADFLGLNFWRRSPRCLSLEAAREITEAVRGRVRLVGVFVNHTPAEVVAIDAALGLDLLQFHGDEPPGEVRAFGDRAIRVLRANGSLRFKPLPEIWGYLFDVHDPQAYGGTGSSWDYRTVAGLVSGQPFLVAGGVRPANARQALMESGACGVDVCSGIESAPGIKDPDLMRQLFTEVRHGQTRPAS